MNIVADRASSRPGDLVIPATFDVDAMPSVPSPWDDEFDGSGQGKWINEVSSGGSFDLNKTVKSHILAQTTTTVRLPSIPPTPFTVTAKCSSVVYDNLTSTAANASLGVGEATLGKFEAIEWDIDTLGQVGPYVGVWANIGASPTHRGTLINTEGFALQDTHYQRVIVASTTDVTYQWSFGGKLWTTIAANANPGFTIASVVILSYACVTAWDWVRFTRP